MATNSSTDFAQLFVELTGETTITEEQAVTSHDAAPATITEAVHATLSETGLEDTLSEPDST
jgi:hypothetical protein